MWPVLFGYIETYYIFWGAALMVMVFWTRRRAVFIYGISGTDAYDILWWVMCGVFIGSTLGGYLGNWERFADAPGKILRFWESGASSGPGFIGGGLFGLYKIKRLGIPVGSFAESASIPCAFMLFIGRWGCFANGCCAGLPTNSPLGVRFLSRPDAAVWPSQLFESTAALIIGISLALLEKKRLKHPDTLNRAVLFPCFLITYGLYRIVFDFLREGRRTFIFEIGQYSGLVAFVVGLFWLSASLKPLKTENG
ncbi:MAG: prolipoprotein diacylglyceryl transferase [Synergistaceae bacterium]|jgi:phosphatidylglycerol:prolipoprotein diacylglycerol transferase|nr:prolipoprotein diacylglyceryl transferase [Synergistaceae bacterium]